ncbi:MAG: hypothetical protein JWP87_5926 [Labilithrix sp.]|jgi:hypothetical protein|nr:hypothetical protein [Labilithrix sp.]
MMTFFGSVSFDAMPGSLSTLAIELPQSITPAMAGLTVGAFVGIVGFVAVMLLVGRGQRRPSRRYARMAADQVVFIPPPYRTPYALPRLPAFGMRGDANANATSANVFRPSTALSARAFAKMGYEVDGPSEDDEPMHAVEIAMNDEDDDAVAPNVSDERTPAVSIAPVIMISAPAKSAADKSAPHPLGVIKSSSTAMRPAPIAELSFDDAPTEIGETYFDEPPQPRRRTDPPKIRPIKPAGPRFPDRRRTEP